MKTLILIISLIGLVAIEPAHAQMKGDTYYLPAVDIEAEKSQALSTKDVPLKYAVNTHIEDIYHSKGKSQSGSWTPMFDGSWEYQLRISAKNATSLNVGMIDFFLPPSAELWVSTDDQNIMRGPYDGSYNQKHGFFWVGDVPADHINIRISVSAGEKQYLSFSVENVTRGFYKYWQEPSYQNKSGSCNVDVACPEGGDWESQINSVGRYSFATSEGGFVCTGQLINNTAQDGTPLFSTADHCGYSGNGGQEPLLTRQNVAASIALTWNYQSLTCRTPESSQSGTQISINGFNQRQSGATYLASNPASDFSLVKLNRIPNANYGLEYTGWDRRDIAPDSAVSIHHPSGHAKRISFENDALSITSYLSTARGAATHLRVEDWDLGTTEGGSSGAGLWNSDQLFVGQLHGGFAACANDSDDWYGRLYVSWDNGNNAQSRLKDWLDPINTGQQTLQGIDGCEAPTISIVNNSTNSVGELLTFASVVNGGSGGYSYNWDINADESIDGTEAEIQARYSHQFVGNINLTVTDSVGCQATATKAVVVVSANVQLQQVINIGENLNQVCGNNDAVIDPGERWSTSLIAKNEGSKTAGDAYLALGVNRSSFNVDTYGTSVTSCARSFIDITNTGTLKTWQSAGTQYPANDEGSVLIQLSQAFNHYGDDITELRASTNGYFSTSTNATGVDWDNDCPLPQTPDKDNVGGRIAPMHDDLKDAVFYHQSFTSCPRTAEVGGDLSCEVFLWKGADIYNPNNSIIESIDIQAILYPDTSQWVYQYAGNGFDGSGSTTGMQNEAASNGLTYACDTANSINATEAVCTFHKNHQPISSAAEHVKLESPVISLGDLFVNESESRNLQFAISEDASCGTSFSLNHEASVYDEGFNAGQNNILSQEIGTNGQCNVVTSCGVGAAADFTSDIKPRRGFWWNPDRDGNGLDLYTFDNKLLVYFFYTGDASGEPVWYLASDADSAYNQYHNNITRYEVPGGFGNGQRRFDVVGWSNTSFINDSTAIQVRMINGNLSAEKQYFFQYAANETPNLHTGSYYTPSEDGWGHSVGTLGNARAVVTYIFDDAGNPYWTIGNGPNDDSAFAVNYVVSFCPSCPAVPATYQVIGDLKMTLDGQLNGTLDRYNANDEGVSWNKTNLPLLTLTPPEN